MIARQNNLLTDGYFLIYHCWVVYISVASLWIFIQFMIYKTGSLTQ